MTDRIAAGTWVELGSVVLPAGERAPQVPTDTQAVPLELRVKGFLVAAAALGEAAAVHTAIGRRLSGTLLAVEPPYAHGFGPPLAELLSIGPEVRAMLLDTTQPDAGHTDTGKSRSGRDE
jgi:hypothetical protein